MYKSDVDLTWTKKIIMEITNQFRMSNKKLMDEI